MRYTMMDRRRDLHTPGPWSIDKGNFVIQRASTDKRPSMRTIASVGATWPFQSQQEAHANAKIIAAAPTMLQVIRYTLTDLKMSNLTHEPVIQLIAKRLEVVLFRIEETDGRR